MRPSRCSAKRLTVKAFADLENLWNPASTWPFESAFKLCPTFTGTSGRADNLYTTVLLLVLLNYSEVVKKNIENMKKN